MASNLVPTRKSKAGSLFQQVGRYSTKLTHVNDGGKANMVDTTSKAETHRIAIARGKVVLGAEAYSLLKENRIKKGDVLSVARIAGINAAKLTGQLIPLCHPLMLSHIQIEFEFLPDEAALCIESTVKTTGRTGVEVEAITAVSIAACTIYDMCKAVSKSIEIHQIYLVHKSGGKTGVYDHVMRVADSGP